jgi:isocitrate lyase
MLSDTDMSDKFSASNPSQVFAWNEKPSPNYTRTCAENFTLKISFTSYIFTYLTFQYIIYSVLSFIYCLKSLVVKLTHK